MGKSGKNGGGGGGGGGLACGFRVLFLCALPVGAVAAGYPPGILSVLLSILAAAAEVALFVVRSRNVSGKRRHSIRPAGFFPLQLLGLYLVQVWLVIYHEASGTGGESLSAAAEAAQIGGANVEALPALREQMPRPSVSGHDDEPEMDRETREAPKAVGFQLDAPRETLRWAPKTISVVLPCAEEREYAFKTVEAVFKSTPQHVLHEIVVVDDGSDPPLSSTHLGPEIQAKYKVKVMRHEQTVGLIGAKKTGGDAAVGDIVAFFDCHVAPQRGWHEDFLTLISENYRRMVVPHITSLDVDTWTQVGSGGGLAKCYLTWDADFKWVDSNDRYIPLISGGLLGMSRRWWQETGGYDKEMLGWGGENIDQSLRVWLCGGEIVMAPRAQVAHMWRDGTQKTSARYPHVGDTARNRARAVYAWYGDFAAKLQHYPHFASRRPAPDGSPWYGDLASFQQVRDRLSGCRPFAWFLKRFSAVYVDGGLLPAEVFMLREAKSGKCLLFQGAAGTSGTGQEGASLEPCNESDDRFFWHPGNVDRRTGKCCSGLRAWNTDQCLRGGQGGGKAVTGICTVAGLDWGQEWSLRENGQLQRGSSCLGPGVEPGSVVEGACLSFRSRGGAQWTRAAARRPLETELYQKALQEHPEVFAGL